MKLKTLSAVIALTLCSTAAMANTYQAEVGVVLGTIDTDAGDADLFGLGGEFFFEAVDTSGKPLAEAAFLQKASSVSAAYAQTDYDGFEISAASLDVGYYFGDSIFYAGATVVSYDFDGESEDDWGVTVGVTPVDGWLVTTTYMDDVDYELNLQSKYVTQLAGETAINFDLGYADGGDFDDIISAGLDYYINHSLSLGVFTESAEETATGVRGRYFFNDQFSAQFSYETEDDVDTIMLGASVRF